MLAREGKNEMAIKYKINIIKALKECNYNSTRIRRENILSQSALQQLRERELVSWANIDRLCRLLNCQPGDILEYIPDPDSRVE